MCVVHAPNVVIVLVTEVQPYDPCVASKQRDPLCGAGCRASECSEVGVATRCARRVAERRRAVYLQRARQRRRARDRQRTADGRVTGDIDRSDR